MRRAAFAGRALAGLGMAALLGGASFSAVDLTRAILPPAAPIDAAPHVVAAGEAILEQPLGAPPSIRLSQSIAAEAAGKHAVLAAGQPLAAARIEGNAMPPLAPGSTVFCAPATINAGAAIANAAALGLFGGLTRTTGASRFCVFDADADQRVETVFMIGAKSREDAAPRAVAPTAYAMQGGDATPGGAARLVYVGPVGLAGGNLGIDLIYRDGGRDSRIERRVVARGDLPVTLAFAGAMLEVRRFDPATKAAEIAVRRGLAPGEYIPPVQAVRSTYIPIYVPRR